MMMMMIIIMMMIIMVIIIHIIVHTLPHRDATDREDIVARIMPEAGLEILSCQPHFHLISTSFPPHFHFQNPTSYQIKHDRSHYGDHL